MARTVAITGHHQPIILAVHAHADSARHAVYVVVVALHVVVALIGFGAVAMAGVYAAIARGLDHPGRIGQPDRREEVLRYFGARSVAEWALVAIPLLGVTAVVVEPVGGGLAQFWVGAALALWVAAAAVVALVARPARARLRAGLAASGLEPDLAPAVVAEAARRLTWAAGVCDVVFVLALADMVFQPG